MDSSWDLKRQVQELDKLPCSVDTPAMHYLVVGLAKTGTTALFTSLRAALPPDTETCFEPRTEEQFLHILSSGATRHTLTKAILGFITGEHKFARRFSPNILIVRDPRDQVVSELLYRFYDFKLRHDAAGYAEGRSLLERKVMDPSSISVVELFNRIGTLVARPGMERLEWKIGFVMNYWKVVQPYVVRYESFVDGDVGALEARLGFRILARPKVDAEFARVARTKSHGEWRMWFSDDDLAFVNARAGEMMRAFGYVAEIRSALPSKLPLSTTLGYVDQFRP
jgi:hypothetical protein